MNRDVWKRRYSSEPQSISRYDGWLDPQMPRLLRVDTPCILDIGCGRGTDAAFLTGKGCRVIYSDFIWVAVSFVNSRTGRKQGVVVDHVSAFPFRDRTFHAVIGNLSLHYFSDVVIGRILHEVKRVLCRDGMFLARFNSTTDMNYGAPPNGETAVVEGVQKHFFTVERLQCLMHPFFASISFREYGTDCYGTEKKLVEVIALKENSC
jgi:SAM-dependent methyltransferase